MPAPRQINTHAIVLRRVNYGEADRILTLITPDYGKLSAIAKGARKAKSKLAGGIELFSISEISFISGKNDIDTLTSTRLQKNFGYIVTAFERSDTAYGFIKTIDKATEDNPEADYFHLLAEGLNSLNEPDISPYLTKLWFNLHLLKTAGHAPDFFMDTSGDKLSADKTYDFDYDQMRFIYNKGREGSFRPDLIKFLRLAASAERPHLLQRVKGSQALAQASSGTVETIIASYF